MWRSRSCCCALRGGLAITGWLYTTDALWGDEMIEEVHRALAWALLALVVLRVAGVIFTSLRHRENLIPSMFNGIKRAPRDTDIQ
jgi:cytochrome b